ncbi:MAG: response regulator [Deltaproteobacteria bacterium]|nr:response regulator [Deltaproteobacteria bacterium]
MREPVPVSQRPHRAARERPPRVLADTWREGLFDRMDALDLPPSRQVRRPGEAVPVFALPEPTPRQRSLRVLVADDDPVLRHILVYQLESAGWRVTTSVDGDEAARLAAEGDFDALVVDLNLPHKNAFELLEGLDLRGRHAALRVVVLSEQVQEHKVVRSFELGAHDFIQKPLNPRVVLSRLSRLVRGA